MVKYQKKIRFINTCDCIVDFELLEKAILWYAKSPTISVKKISMYGYYPGVSIGKEKIHVHRLLGLYVYGLTNVHYHHKDGNKLNSSLDNIVPMNPHRHLSEHNKGKSRHTPEQKQKLIEFNHTRKGKRVGNRRKDLSKERVYELKIKGYSFNEISKMYSIDWSCVKQRYNDFIHDNPELLNQTT